jgi:hypothetical protein
LAGAALAGSHRPNNKKPINVLIRASLAGFIGGIISGNGHHTSEVEMNVLQVEKKRRTSATLVSILRRLGFATINLYSAHMAPVMI